MNIDQFTQKDISGCAIVGIMDQSGNTFSGRDIIDSISIMHDRSNGLGGGFAAYGIYPENKEDYCFHLLFEDNASKHRIEHYIKEHYEIKRKEPIPVRKSKKIPYHPNLWRYFLQPKKEIYLGFIDEENQNSIEDFIIHTVMHINTKIDDAFVCSSGKNMGVFKGVGYPEDIGEFYKLEDYKAYIWTAHGRFPTNTVGWWGGAHPFGIGEWTVVHNGEISSYGINKRFLKSYGYDCVFMTDTEPIIYMFDLFVRKQKLNFEMVANILSAPFWKNIERQKLSEEQKEQSEIAEALRIAYGGALLNGPFGIIVANKNFMVALNDRIKLRNLVCATKGEKFFIASEESAIREICPELDKVWMPKGGEPVIGRLKTANENIFNPFP